MLQPAMLSTDGLTIPQEADCTSPPARVTTKQHANVEVVTGPAFGVIEAGCQLSKGVSLHSSQRLSIRKRNSQTQNGRLICLSKPDHQMQHNMPCDGTTLL